MSSKVLSYLLTLRMQWSLTQAETARLLGLKSDAHVSMLEQEARPVTTATLIAYMVIFGVPVETVVPQLVQEVTERTLRSGRELFEELRELDTPEAARKRE